jgi:hypothetical protein
VIVVISHLRTEEEKILFVEDCESLACVLRLIWAEYKEYKFVESFVVKR